MSIKLQTNLDYEALCKELGVTIEELVQLVKNKDQHLSSSHNEVSLVQVIEEYRDNLKKLQSLSRRSNNTISTYLNFLKRVSDYNERNPLLKITELNEDMIFEILEVSKPRKNTELSTNTVNKYMAIIRSVVGYAFEQGYTEKDLRYKFAVKTISTLPRYLNDLQIEKVLNGALQKTYGYRKRAMLLFLLGTGCRVSELTNIRVSDFIVDENLIFIRNGKGNKERYIPMFKEVKAAILHYLKLSGVPSWKSDIKGYLFTQDEGIVREKKVLERSVQLLVRDLFDAIGLGKDFTVHSFRHTFAVKCLKAGIKEPYLMQMLGHEDPKTTAIYTKLIPNDLKEEVMKFYPFPFEDLLDDLI
jgi:site-specific recombinase XerD